MDPSSHDALGADALRRRFSGRVEDLARATGTRFHREAVAELISGLEAVAHSGLGLEVGCGTGALVAAWTARGRRAIGLDLTREMCERARTETGCSTVVADAARLPFATGSLAVVAGTFHFQLLPDPERALSEVRRVLGAGGRHGIVIQTPEWTPERATDDARAWGLDESASDALVRCANRSEGTMRYTDAELDALFTGGGFTGVAVRRIAGGRLQCVVATRGDHLGGL